MNNQQEDSEEIVKGVDAALHRAALKAKEEAERNGTPYVVVESKQEHTAYYTSLTRPT